SLALNWNQEREKFDAAIQDLDVVDADVRMWPMIKMTWLMNTPGKLQGERAWKLAYKHQDDTAWDLFAVYHLADKQTAKAYAQRWLEVSPRCPPAMCALMMWDNEAFDKHAAEWEKEYGYYP